MSSQKSEAETTVAEARSSRGWLGLGVAFVIGAVAANVFGFRHSRWATGKEFYRAWERQNANENARRAAASARKKSAQKNSSSAASSGDSDFSRAEASSRGSSSKHATSSGRNGSSFFSSSTMFEDFARQAEEEAERRSNRARDDSWRNGSQQGNSKSTRSQRTGSPFDFDDEEIAAMLRMFNSVPGGGRWTTSSFRTQGPVNMNADMLRQLEEMMRAAQAADAAFRSGPGRMNRGDSAGFESYETWEEVFGSSTTGRNSRTGFGQGTHADGGAGAGRGPSFSQGNRAGALAALGLNSSASSADVKRAYRELVFKYHPDHYRGSDAEGAARKFQEIRQAYDVLR